MSEMDDRTDPWRWYCRLCGEQGEAADSEARDIGALSHLGTEHPGPGRRLGRASEGHLLHVWNYGHP